MSDLLLVFGVLSGVLGTLAFVPYIFDSATGRSFPQRASWLIWSVLGAIAFFSQVYEGGGASLWFAGAQVSGTVIVLLVSVWAGTGTYLREQDKVILIVAAFGVGAWITTENAAYALGISIAIGVLAGSVTVAKAYRAHQTETMSTWVISFVASIFAILSVGHFDPVLLAYPVYLFTLYGAIITAMLMGRARDMRKVAKIPVKGVNSLN